MEVPAGRDLGSEDLQRLDERSGGAGDGRKDRAPHLAIGEGPQEPLEGWERNREAAAERRPLTERARLPLVADLVGDVGAADIAGRFLLVGHVASFGSMSPDRKEIAPLRRLGEGGDRFALGDAIA